MLMTASRKQTFSSAAGIALCSLGIVGAGMDAAMQGSFARVARGRRTCPIHKANSLEEILRFACPWRFAGSGTITSAP